MTRPGKRGKDSIARLSHRHPAHADVLPRERQECHVAAALDRRGQRALVVRAGAGLPARLDLTTFRDIAAEPARVLVIDDHDLVGAEGTDLPTRHVAAAVLPLAARRASR